MKKIIALLLLTFAVAACTLKPLPEIPTLGDIQLPLVEAENQNWLSSDYQDKPIFMVFMGSWCPYCKMTMPAVAKVANEFGNEIEFVAVFMDQDPEPVKVVTKEHNFTVKATYAGDNPAEELGVNGLPHVVLTNKNHKVVKTWEGFSPTLEEEFRESIQKILK